MLWYGLVPLAALLPFGSIQFANTTEPIHNPLESAIVFGIVRLIWSSATVWICLELASGHGGIIHRFLSADIFQPFSRLSFATYMIHIVVIWHNFFSFRSPIDISMQNMVRVAVDKHSS